MSWLDILILIPLLIGLVRGLMRGVIMEVTAILAVILGFIGARLWNVPVATWLLNQFAWPESVCFVLAYTVLFLGITLILNIFARLLSKLFQKIQLGWLNRLLGGVFGCAKWALVVFVLVLCLHRLDNQFAFLSPELKEQSVVYSSAAPLSEKVWENFKQQMDATRSEGVEEKEQ